MFFTDFMMKFFGNERILNLTFFSFGMFKVLCSTSKQFSEIMTSLYEKSFDFLDLNLGCLNFPPIIPFEDLNQLSNA